MTIKPVISIIIPVYNGANYLGDAIDSALEQSDKHFEIIVVNDGSTDGGKTESIAKSYGNKIRYYKKKNGRVASALNYGIKRMKGDWFAWLSHDDIYLPNKVKDELLAIKKYPKAKAFYGNTAVVDEGRHLITSNNPVLPKRVFGGAWYFKTWIYGCSFIVHKNCFKEVGYFNEKNRTAQDVEMILALLSRYEFIHIPKILSQRRDHEASDFHQLHELNVSEGDQMMLDLLKIEGIEYFYPGHHNNSDSYNDLAWLLIQGNPKISAYCYLQSRQFNQSILNPATILSTLGTSNLKLFIDLYYFMRNSARGLVRKVSHVFHFWF